MEVDSGGFASGTTISSGGLEIILGGTTVSSQVFGVETVSAGGTSISTTINSGGVENVSGYSKDAQVLGDLLNVFYGGAAVGASACETVLASTPCIPDRTTHV